MHIYFTMHWEKHKRMEFVLWLCAVVGKEGESNSWKPQPQKAHLTKVIGIWPLAAFPVTKVYMHTHVWS